MKLLHILIKTIFELLSMILCHISVHIAIDLLPKRLHIKRVELEFNLCVQRKFLFPLSEQE